ncbi:MAG: hypothetical protein QGF59_08570, partial [Pirellulaceae bacterium]|nr:hypothetical protein [Pirellulaceae bacterium]
TVSGANVLTNAASGVINSNVGSGGGRNIYAHVDNDGTVNINKTTGLGKTGGVYTNNGTTTIASGKTLSFGSSSVFNQDSGLLAIAGTYFMSSNTLNFNGGVITGTPLLLHSALNLGAGSTSPASFITRGSSTLSGDVKSGQLITVQGSGSGTGTLTSASGYTNSGTITLQSIDGGYTTNLTVSGANVLTNAASGVINSNVGSGGGRNIYAHVDNDGTVNFNKTTGLGKTSGVYTNNGTTTVASGKTLNFGNSSVFNQDGGLLAVAGTFFMSSDTLNFNGGTITGTPLLEHSALNLGAGSTSPASFITRGSSTLSGTVKSGQLITVQGSGTGGTGTLTSASGYTNSGTITLQSIDGGYTTNLVVSSGTLTNAASGVINSNVGSGGGRNIYTHFECARISLAEGEAMNSLKPLVGTLRVKKSRPAKGGHQPEVSLARSRV